jgi:hypothetical protein
MSIALHGKIPAHTRIEITPDLLCHRPLHGPAPLDDRLVRDMALIQPLGR